MAVSQLLMPGVVLGGDFEIARPIGQGGMGTVYEALQRTTGAPRAVKVMRSGLAADPRFRARFDQEARVSARIPSDHVVQVVGAGLDEATHMPWIAMELLVGQTMQDWLDAGVARGAGEVAILVEQLCHALGAAHGVGVVHRDLKPENIFLSRARVVGVPFVVKVLDFGVAKIVSDARGVTVAVGTPAYMAPEQTAASADVGPPADVWALGLLVFRLMTGRPYWRALAAGDGGRCSCGARCWSIRWWRRRSGRARWAGRRCRRSSTRGLRAVCGARSRGGSPTRARPIRRWRR